MSAISEAIEQPKRFGGIEFPVIDSLFGDQVPHGVRWDTNTGTVIISGPLPKDQSGSWVLANGQLFSLPARK